MALTADFSPAALRTGEQAPALREDRRWGSVPAEGPFRTGDEQFPTCTDSRSLYSRSEKIVKACTRKGENGIRTKQWREQRNHSLEGFKNKLF